MTATQEQAQALYDRLKWGKDDWQEIAAALAEAEARGHARGVAEAGALRERVEGLFSGGPDTVCRTTWRESATTPECSASSIECVEVPLDDLRRALDGDA